MSLQVTFSLVRVYVQLNLGPMFDVQVYHAKSEQLIEGTIIGQSFLSSTRHKQIFKQLFPPIRIQVPDRMFFSTQNRVYHWKHTRAVRSVQQLTGKCHTIERRARIWVRIYHRTPLLCRWHRVWLSLFFYISDILYESYPSLRRTLLKYE